MQVPQTPTVQDALASFYAREQLPGNGGSDARRWAIKIGAVSVTLPNFRWREEALPLHDLHHLLTGYPCTPSGEFEMAAWEFAAGRYPHPFATVFCLPLVGVGAVLRPRRTFRAFVRGRASTTLYAQGVTASLLRSSIEQLRRATVPAVQPRVPPADGLAYVFLVLASIAWLSAPVVLLAAAAWVA